MRQLGFLFGMCLVIIKTQCQTQNTTVQINITEFPVLVSQYSVTNDYRFTSIQSLPFDNMRFAAGTQNGSIFFFTQINLAEKMGPFQYMLPASAQLNAHSNNNAVTALSYSNSALYSTNIDGTLNIWGLHPSYANDMSKAELLSNIVSCYQPDHSINNTITSELPHSGVDLLVSFHEDTSDTSFAILGQRGNTFINVLAVESSLRKASLYKQINATNQVKSLALVNIASFSYNQTLLGVGLVTGAVTLYFLNGISAFTYAPHAQAVSHLEFIILQDTSAILLSSSIIGQIEAYKLSYNTSSQIQATGIKGDKTFTMMNAGASFFFQSQNFDDGTVLLSCITDTSIIMAFFTEENGITLSSMPPIPLKIIQQANIIINSMNQPQYLALVLKDMGDQFQSKRITFYDIYHGYQLNTANSNIYVNCEVSQFTTQYGECLACDNTCLTCSNANDAHACIKCKENAFYIDAPFSGCFPRCPTSYVSQPLTSVSYYLNDVFNTIGQQQCVKNEPQSQQNYICADGCLACSGPTVNDCLLCMQYGHSQTIAFDKCCPPFYFQDEKGLCILCSQRAVNCKQCSLYIVQSTTQIPPSSLRNLQNITSNVSNSSSSSSPNNGSNSSNISNNSNISVSQQNQSQQSNTSNTQLQPTINNVTQQQQSAPNYQTTNNSMQCFECEDLNIQQISNDGSYCVIKSEYFNFDPLSSKNILFNNQTLNDQQSFQLDGKNIALIIVIPICILLILVLGFLYRKKIMLTLNRSNKQPQNQTNPVRLAKSTNINTNLSIIDQIKQSSSQAPTNLNSPIERSSLVLNKEGQFQSQVYQVQAKSTVLGGGSLDQSLALKQSAVSVTLPKIQDKKKELILQQLSTFSNVNNMLNLPKEDDAYLEDHMSLIEKNLQQTKNVQEIQALQTQDIDQALQNKASKLKTLKPSEFMNDEY